MLQIVGKYMILAGVLLVVLGGIILLAGKVPWIGRLPGDILIKKENVTFYCPITTCIIVSVVLSVLFYLFSKK